jgi:hypothetical protein
MSVMNKRTSFFRINPEEALDHLDSPVTVKPVLMKRRMMFARIGKRQSSSEPRIGKRYPYVSRIGKRDKIQPVRLGK